MSSLESVGSVLILDLNHDDRPTVLEQERTEEAEQLAEPQVDPLHVIFIIRPQFDVLIFQQPGRQSSEISLSIHVGAGAQDDVESNILSCFYEGDDVLVAGEDEAPWLRLV